MKETAPDLNALLGSRICHDLISPLGAISNGLELLSMAGGADGPEMNLINDSVQNANARIRFFRVAYGASGAGQEIARPEILAILGPLSSSRLHIDWQVEGNALRAEVKLAFLLIQCLETAMAWGGSITVWRNDAQWRLEGRAERIKPLPDLWPAAIRIGDAGEIGANHVQFLLADGAARDAGRRITLNETESLVSLSF